MGKRYYCHYCDKSMVSSAVIVKQHNKGLLHKKLVQEHYQQYKDPITILNEESKKKPCNRFFNGECHFGVLCRYSHYTKEQILALNEDVARKQSTKLEIQQPSFDELYNKLQLDKQKGPHNVEEGTTVISHNDGVTVVFPWVYNDLYKNYGADLPPSLREICLTDFESGQINTWGSTE